MTDTIERSATEARELLAAAVNARRAFGLRWQATSGLASVRSRSIRATDDGGVPLAVTAADGVELAGVRARDGRVLVTTRHDGRDLLFSLAVLDVTTDRADGGATARLALPDGVIETARRHEVRVEIAPEDRGLLVARAWRIAPRVPLRDRPAPSGEFVASLRDVSGGGARLILSPKHAVTVPAQVGDRMRVELQAGGQAMLFDGHVITVSTMGGASVCGVSFVQGGRDVERRRDAEALHKIIADLQRREIRRVRAA